MTFELAMTLVGVFYTCCKLTDLLCWIDRHH